MVSNREESHLSGTYIRSLVKQIACSSRSKDAMNPKIPSGKDQSPGNIPENSGDGSGKNCKFPQPHKKQVRRRLHTSRPYQERLLNMAEARREIVAALKQHRAAMKQASEQQKQQQQQLLLRQQHAQKRTEPEQSLLDQEARSSKWRQNPNFLDPNPFSCPCVVPPSLPPPPPPDPFSWPVSNISNTAFNFVLPNQPLGLNLNFQDFNNIIETSPFYQNLPVYSSPPSSSASTTSPVEDLPPLAVVSREEVGPARPESESAGGGGGLHQAMDEEKMAEMRTMGEKHQIAWNDTVNLVTSAWWIEFLKSVELEQPPAIDDDVFRRPFDDVMEFPTWLNPKEDFLQPCLSDYSSSDDHLQDPALSWYDH